MGDNTAVLQGYTMAVTLSNANCELYLLCKPDTDFSTRFCAWDTVESDFIVVNGWMFSVETYDED